jgi:uncharacterized protein Yka (UPF0111/DUF47 family)
MENNKVDELIKIIAQLQKTIKELKNNYDIKIESLQDQINDLNSRCDNIECK